MYQQRSCVLNWINTRAFEHLMLLITLVSAIQKN